MSEKPDYPYLGLDARRAAKSCGVSTSLWYRMDSAGQCPKAARLGTKRVWVTSTLELWLRANCPARNSEKWIKLLEKHRG